MIRLFRVFIPTTAVALLFSEAILISACYVLASFVWGLLRPEFDAATYLLYDGGWASIGGVTVFILFGLYFNDLYENFSVQEPVGLFQQLCMIVGGAFLFQAIVTYVNRNWTLPKWMMIIGSSLALMLLFGWRLLFQSTVWRVVGTQRILFLGASPLVFELTKHLHDRPQFGMMPVGFLHEGTPESPDDSLPSLGYIGDLAMTMETARPSTIVVALTDWRQRLPVQDLLELRFKGIHVEDIAHLYEKAFSRVCTRTIRPSDLIFSSELGPQKHSLRVQAIYSFALATIGIILTLPVMGVVALLIRITSKGPILFRQTRVGLNNKTFTIFKFRSMYTDAEAGTGAVWATRNDPRITPLGRWLRKLRLDELPQLFNVVRGEMSIVGPRPERPEFVTMLSEKIPFYRQRHCVMPGITGWAQINYKYGDTVEDSMMKLEYDLYYIKHISIALDFIIMFHTAKTMLLFRGAQ